MADRTGRLVRPILFAVDDDDLGDLPPTGSFYKSTNEHFPGNESGFKFTQGIGAMSAQSNWSLHDQSNMDDNNTEHILDRTTRKKINYNKSLQLLEEEQSNTSLFIGGANPMLKESGTPTALFNKGREMMEKSLHQSESNRTHDRENFSLNISHGSDWIAAPYRAKKTVRLQDKSFIEEAAEQSNLSLVIESDPVMQGTKGLFSAFMESVTTFSKSSECFELISSFHGILEQENETLLAFLKKNDPCRKRFQKTAQMLALLFQECYTWRLIGSLFRDRIQSDSMDVTFEPLERMDCFKSETNIVNAFYERDSVVRHCQLIVDWLEKNAEDSLKELISTNNLQFGSDSVAREQTIAELHHAEQRNKSQELLPNLVTEVDPDAPIRQRRNLADLDEEDEQRLLRYIFAHIRAGQLEKAQEICCKYGQSWRAATLDGWRLWNDANYVTESETGELIASDGNPYRDIWKATCWEMAEEDGISLYEKAVYAALSGNLKHLLPICSTWEDLLWAYFKVFVDVQVEQELNLHSRTDRPTETLPMAYWNQLHSLSPEKIFAEMTAHPNQMIRRQSQEHFRVFQRLLILNEVDDLFTEMHKVLKTEHFCRSHLVRFMAHLSLFLQTVGIQVQEKVCNDILKAYIEILVESKQIDLIACYTSKLAPHLQVEVYSNFLESIHEKSDREKCLRLAEEAGLDTAVVTKTVVENIRNKEMHFEEDELAESEIISEADRRQIEAIQWLVFDQSLRSEAMKQANAIIRCFLATGKVHASLQVFEKLPEDSIDVVYKEWQKTAGECQLPEDDENAINEYLCIRAYLDAHSAFNDWYHHYHSLAPAKPTEEKWKSFTEKVEFEQKINEYDMSKQRWKRNLDIYVEEAKDKLYNVLLFPEGWMVDKAQNSMLTSEDASRSQQLLLLRQICLPLICSMLQSVLKSNGQHKEFLQLADIIQSETHGLYEVFQKDQLQRLLMWYKDASVALLGEGKDAFGYSKLS